MNIVQLARCAFGTHARDRTSVRLGSHWPHGRCKGCGAPMVKGPDGWKLEGKHAA